MIEWQETLKKAYELGSRMLGVVNSEKKRIVRLAFGTYSLQMRWDKDGALEMRVSEPEVDESNSSRLSLYRPDKESLLLGVIATRIGQTEEKLKALLDELLDKWQLAEGKLTN